MRQHMVLLAAGLGLAGYLFGRRSQITPPAPGERSRARDWHPVSRPGADGRLSQDALADEASADSFPASDPPSAMTSVIPGSPAR